MVGREGFAERKLGGPRGWGYRQAGTAPLPCPSRSVEGGTESSGIFLAEELCGKGRVPTPGPGQAGQGTRGAEGQPGLSNREEGGHIPALPLGPCISPQGV